jgi:hypothetical protein
VYLIPDDGNGVFPCTSQGLIKNHLFPRFAVTAIAADLQTNLLYFTDFHTNTTISIGNEQGELIHQFRCSDLIDKIFVSCGIIMTLNAVITHFHSVNIYTTNGKKISEVRDYKISKNSDICLVYNKGIFMTMGAKEKNVFTRDKTTTHLWRIV